MSLFAAKRKARVIKVSDDDDAGDQPTSSSDSGNIESEVSKPLFGSKNSRKPFRQSGLRKAFNPPNDDTENADPARPSNGDEESDGPVVVRPNFGRKASSNVKNRKKKATTLSFGDDGEDAGEEEESAVKTPNKFPLGKRALENSSLKKGLATRGLPMRSVQDDDDRPRYSQEYLEELQSSTPNTPRGIVISAEEIETMDIDEAELDGALIVESPSLSTQPAQQTTILSEAEIRERKERRDRLAKEQDFLSVEDEDEDYLGRKKKPETRLKQDEDDIGEGFDNFVEDGGLSLGKRAEKERRKRDRKEMAELITAAEGHSSDDSSDSDAERRIAYESAQTRAGLDGLKKPKKDPTQELLQVPAKITPIPNLSECVSKLQISLQAMQEEIRQKTARVQQLRNEKQEILKREKEVQTLLDETGKKYQEAMGQGKNDNAIGPDAGIGGAFAGERGLESIGRTPVRDEGEDDM
ncbi:unnamed protein product [Clonostachys rhizophaga]|uniref:Nineteen complex-related protein 2-domain-containing protein n=1 Tax=Clonostachys rhizophaga TaxID=160324 RepID=A0A9N9VT11_9HYPO|nr:unnamed protein product [Clonostachys rhizophaga]